MTSACSINTMPIQLNSALLVGASNYQIQLHNTWNIPISSLEKWYANMIIHANELGIILVRVFTYYEEIPVVFYIGDDMQLQVEDVTYLDLDIEN